MLVSSKQQKVQLLQVVRRLIDRRFRFGAKHDFPTLGSWGKGASPKVRSLRKWFLTIDRQFQRSVVQKETLSGDNECRQVVVKSQVQCLSYLNISAYHQAMQSYIPLMPEFQTSSPEVVLLSLRRM